MKNIILTIAAVIITLVTGTWAFIIIEEHKFLTNVNLNSGPDITRYAGYETKWALNSYLKFGNVDTVEYWLSNGYLDGGPAISAGIALQRWAFKNRDNFLSLTEELSTENKKKICDLLVFSVVDCGQGEKFRKVFSKHRSLTLDSIFIEIEKSENYAKDLVN